jgi:hypothetical protein
VDSQNFREKLKREKTPCLEELFISLKSYWSIDVQNGLTWPIWTFATQVMAKRKVRSQTDNLILEHKKSWIDSIPFCAGGAQHAFGNLSTRTTSSV